MTTNTTSQPACRCGRTPTRGRYCESCLDNEIEWNQLSQEDLQAAADLHDRLLQQQQEPAGRNPPATTT